MDLVGKVAVVTGASRGIGKAIALALAAAGADVACLATTAGNAMQTTTEVEARGRKSVALGCSVQDVQRVRLAFEEVRDVLGPVDILVNNAGITRPTPILKMTEEDWDSVMDVNAKSVFLCSQMAVRHMLGKGGGGCVINIGSITGENAFPNRLGYCASKAAVHHMTRVMAIEWAEYGIRVNAIAPGYVRTEMIEGLVAQGAVDITRLEGRVPQRRLGMADEVAEVAVFLAGDKARYMTGSIVTVDGGWTAYGYI